MKEEIIKKSEVLALHYGPKILGAIVTLFIGLWVIKLIRALIVKALEKSKLDETVKNFLGNIFSAILKVGLLISVAGMIGIETTSFVAVLGAAGLAIGMALQGSLSNFAGGVLILIFKPIRIGDFITAQGHSGTVKDIQLFTTKLLTGDNKTIFLPNGPLAGGAITNVSMEDLRRVDFTFGIGYSDDINLAKTTLREIVQSCEKVLKDKDTKIEIMTLNESSVDFVVRPWCKKEDYWDVYFEVTEKVKKVFDEKNISIPFPQRDVHLYQVKSSL